MTEANALELYVELCFQIRFSLPCKHQQPFYRINKRVISILKGQLTQELNTL